ncbi:MAG: AAA family ATPase, partial [Duodenibacillus sp.]
MIPRDLVGSIVSATPPKAVVIYGPRRAGKTTLVKSLLGPTAGRIRLFNADRAADVRVLQGLESAGDVDVFLHSADTIVIDEAQRVPSIGLITKILVDANERTKLFLTGSSSFNLAQGKRESAVGRIVNRQLWPFSVHELAQEYGWGYIEDRLEQFLVYGLFPDNVLRPDEAVEMLLDFVGDIMYKDAFSLSQIRNPTNLRTLVY